MSLLSKCKTPRQIEIVKAAELHGPEKAAGILGIDPRNVYMTMARVRKYPDVGAQDISALLAHNAKSVESVTKKHRYTAIITSAQNSTPVHSMFFANLKVFASHIGAALMVVPFRYKNPTSRFVDSGLEAWAPEVLPYLCDADTVLCKNLAVLGQLKTQPTASRPTSGLEMISGRRSAIIGHAKLEMRCVATPGSDLPKILVSTGACTVPNYTDSKAGYKGEKHHSLSAIVVEVLGDLFFIYEIEADKRGNFYHMQYLVANEEVQEPISGTAHLLALGDLHGVNCDEDAVAASKDQISALKPPIITMDDTLDFESASHHTRKDPVKQYHLAMAHKNNILGEMVNTFATMSDIVEGHPYATAVVKRSNHDEHFERWLKETDPRTDPINARVWCECYTQLLDHNDPYVYLAHKHLHHIEQFKFLERDEEFIVNEVAHDGHGDLGANGSRGSLASYTKLGRPGQWGHSHTPGIMDDQYQHGTLSKLRMGYNRGPSSWVHCNTLQYYNGKRTHLFIINGKWRFE